jgi:RNA polymerase sigma-70 factor, ECF subfamily
MPTLDPQSLPRHTDRLFRAAWALCGSRDDAEDLVQETFARVLARPRTLHGQDELAYLMRALRNTFLIQRRTASRRPQVSTATLDDVEPVDPRASSRPEDAAQAREVFAAIATLSESHRLALVAVDIVGLSYREAAEALHTREETIAVRLFRARERAARALTGGDRTAAAAHEDGKSAHAHDAETKSADARDDEQPAPPREDRPRRAGRGVMAAARKAFSQVER